MSVNLYDVAYDLEKAMRQSDDFQHLKMLYDQVNQDPLAKQLFDRFRDIQMNLQQKQMMGEDISDEEVEEAQNSVVQVQQHEVISQLMEAEQKMSMLIAELSKIMMKPLEELYGSLGQ